MKTVKAKKKQNKIKIKRKAILIALKDLFSVIIKLSPLKYFI